MLITKIRIKIKKKKIEKNNTSLNDEEEEDLMDDESINPEQTLDIFSADSGPNKKDLFNASSSNQFNLFSKHQFIVLLIVSIALLISISLFLTLFGLVLKLI